MAAKYEAQRESKTPPHVPIKYIRLASNQSLEHVVDRIREETGRTYSKGAICAVENGLRGASSELLEALEVAYGLPVGSISTEYTPRAARVRKRNPARSVGQHGSELPA